MDEKDVLAEQFEANRARLTGVSYRMLGSTAEADDAVQEAWLRLSRSDASGIENLSAWLTTVVGRVSLDILRARKARDGHQDGGDQARAGGEHGVPRAAPSYGPRGIPNQCRKSTKLT